MIAKAPCIPCLINQGINAVKRLNLDDDKQKEIALELVRYLSSLQTIDKSPAYYAYYIQKLVKELTGQEDPFYEIKKLSNAKAYSILKNLKEKDLDLREVLILSGAGNAVDFAIKDSVNLDDILNIGVGRFEYESFVEEFLKARSILIVGDNAGEIAFDTLLVEKLVKAGKEVVYAVKSHPILNDALMEDAIEVGMDKLCRVIENGSDKVGTFLEDCSEEFRKTFYESDIVISKGQANYETLSSSNRKVFFLLTVKCKVIEGEAKSPQGKVAFFVGGMYDG